MADLRFDFIRTEVIGDFPENDAREFAQGWLNRLQPERGQGAVANMTEPEWEKMYNVCGGNALQLTNAVVEWKRAMERGKTLETGKEGDADWRLAAASMHG